MLDEANDCVFYTVTTGGQWRADRFRCDRFLRSGIYRCNASGHVRHAGGSAAAYCHVTCELIVLSLQMEVQQKNTISGKLQPDIHVRLGRRDDPLLLVYARQFLEQFG